MATVQGKANMEVYVHKNEKISMRLSPFPFGAEIVIHTSFVAADPFILTFVN